MVPEGSPLRGAVTPLVAHFVGDVTVAEALRTICTAAIEATPTADVAGVATTVDVRVGTYVIADPEVQQLEEDQYRTGDGPGAEALRTGRTVVIEFTSDDGSHTRFRQAADVHGFRSAMAVPLTAGPQTVGALTLYAREAHALTASTAAELEELAIQAAFTLLNHQAYWDARSLSENLEHAMASRAVIEQAKGIIMATNGCTPDEAFEQLRQQSQHENVKVREIAAEIVQRTQRR